MRRAKVFAVAASAVLFAMGGCAMYLTWGVWGVFVACSALTLTIGWAPAIALLPPSKWRLDLYLLLALWAVFFMFIGWGLLALLNPEYVIGWHIPGRLGGLDVGDVFDAHLAGWGLLVMGTLCIFSTFGGVIRACRHSRLIHQQSAATRRLTTEP